MLNAAAPAGAAVLAAPAAAAHLLAAADATSEAAVTVATSPASTAAHFLLGHPQVKKILPALGTS